MRKIPYFLFLLVPVCCLAQDNAAWDWTQRVRIAGYGLKPDNAATIVQDAVGSHVFGIETDNDLNGRYDSFVDPTVKLEAIRRVAERAHAAGQKAFIYTAALECITDHADEKQHTFFKDHPDWVQRKISGEPAVFTGGAAFWISKGDEDVWISPYAPEWRRLYMQRIRQIAATGIDGVYVDIPYWMTHFEGWEDSWASFDDYTVAAFRARTGLDARKDIRLGDYDDPGFRRWIRFRIDSLTEFVREIDTNVKAANPNCKTIPEIYPGLEAEAARVGADVYELYPVVDAIAHEYEYEGGQAMAASKTPLDWLNYMIGMFAFRSFAEGKASWMLSYSWDGEKKINPGEAMRNLFAAQITAGTHPWDAKGHVMSRSNDIETRRIVYAWLAEHERTFFAPRRPLHPIGVYFSPDTRNFFPHEFIDAFRGVMAMLLQEHLEVEVVTPRTLAAFGGPALVLPDVRCLSDSEIALLRKFRSQGGYLDLTGQTAAFNENRDRREPAVDWFADAGKEEAARVTVGSDSPGSDYSRALAQAFDTAAAQGRVNPQIDKLRGEFVRSLRTKADLAPLVEVHASPFVVSQTAEVDGKPHVFLVNFKGLKSKEIAAQQPESGVTVSFPASGGAKVYLLPFLGQRTLLHCSPQAGRLSCTLPDLSKAAVVWLEGS
jgi:Glycosyl hydrolase-like 10